MRYVTTRLYPRASVYTCIIAVMSGIYNYSTNRAFCIFLLHHMYKLSAKYFPMLFFFLQDSKRDHGYLKKTKSETVVMVCIVI